VPKRVDAGDAEDAAHGTPPDEVDYTRVMQLTFVTTILAGVPLVVVLSLFATLPTWTARAGFAVRVGALVWLVTGVGIFLRERRRVQST
jgi:hypothetical protein